MAPTKEAVPDFSAFITAEREKKKNQNLAQQIFGKNRRASAPGGGLPNKTPVIGGSLASRVGVQKRGTSSARSSPKPTPGNVNAEWTHDLHDLNNPPSKAIPRGPRAGRNAGNNHSDRLRNALSNSASSPALNSQFNIVGTSKPGISIRGTAAGPYCVVAKNLAAGTTAADIESAMAPMGGVVLSCVVIVERPNVIAEIVFETKEGADNVVETFNKQNADGHILEVYHRTGPLSSAHKFNSRPAKSEAPARTSTPLGPRADQQRDRNTRKDREDDIVMDGSHGFNDRMDTDDTSKSRGGLYSDRLISRGGRGRGNARDSGRPGGSDRGRGFR